MEELSRADEALRKSIKDFMEVGRDRNRLIHQDFATFPLEKTTDEIYQQYKSALVFVELKKIAEKSEAVLGNSFDPKARARRAVVSLRCRTFLVLHTPNWASLVGARTRTLCPP